MRTLDFGTKPRVHSNNLSPVDAQEYPQRKLTRAALEECEEGRYKSTYLQQKCTKRSEWGRGRSSAGVEGRLIPIVPRAGSPRAAHRAPIVGSLKTREAKKTSRWPRGRWNILTHIRLLCRWNRPAVPVLLPSDAVVDATHRNARACGDLGPSSIFCMVKGGTLFQNSSSCLRVAPRPRSVPASGPFRNGTTAGDFLRLLLQLPPSATI
jgi:hypothetical protein